jgi:hypothetical protein
MAHKVKRKIVQDVQFILSLRESEIVVAFLRGNKLAGNSETLDNLIELFTPTTTDGFYDIQSGSDLI